MKATRNSIDFTALSFTILAVAIAVGSSSTLYALRHLLVEMKYIHRMI